MVRVPRNVEPVDQRRFEVLFVELVERRFGGAGFGSSLDGGWSSFAIDGSGLKRYR